MCNQPSSIKEHIIQKGLSTMQTILQQKIQHWQEKQKLTTVSPAFYHAVEKAICKTLS